MSPRGVRERAGLNRPTYARPSACGSLGRPAEADGTFSCERRDLVDELRRAFD